MVVDMRVVESSVITNTVKDLCITSNYCLNEDILKALQEGLSKEESDTGKIVLKVLLRMPDLQGLMVWQCARIREWLYFC